MNMNELNVQFAQLKKDIAAANVSSLTNCNNNTRRVLYSRLELLRLDYEESFPDVTSGDGDGDGDGEKESKEGNKTLKSHGSMSNIDANLAETLSAVYGEMDILGINLRIIPLYSSRKAAGAGGLGLFHSIWRFVDIVIRFIAVCLGFTTIGSLLSLPVIALQYIDNHVLLPLGVVTCYTQYSEQIRRWIGNAFLLLSGIFVTSEGLEHDYYSAEYMARARSADPLPRHAFSIDPSHSCSMLTFSHSSNIDGFLICSTCPIRHFALAKKELFVTPLFSWISLAVGGVPIDRNNRDRAINALKRSTQAVMAAGSTSATSGAPNQACIVIAPEGTRSTTGQLLPFKKGPFYMWEQLNVPVIPLLIQGAYDLYPVGSWVNDTGHVTVRYLPPIYPEQAASRAEMASMLRRAYLRSIIDTPERAALVQPLTWGEFTLHYGAIGLLFIIDWAIYEFGKVLFFDVWQYASATLVFLHLSGVTIAITAFLYIYFVYVVGAGSGSGSGSGSSGSKKSNKKKD